MSDLYDNIYFVVDQIQSEYMWNINRFPIIVYNPHLLLP